jgi:16S rRNA (cytidine1402-2'-O)-methyltransferase
VLFVVATPIGNLSDISARALEVLGDVEVVFAEDTRHSAPLLAHFGIRRPLISLHEHNEQERIDQVLARLAQGQRLALISDAGTPLISDPGFRVVRAAREAGFEVSPVPGPSSAIAALSVAGIASDRFVFEGFLPARPGERRARLEDLADEPRTLIVFESGRRLPASLRDMAACLGGDRRACLARELTKLHETIRVATLAELAEQTAGDPDQRRGELVVVIQGSGGAPRPAGLDVDRVMDVLLAELPLKQAVSLAARITGEPRNRLYKLALARDSRQR